MRRWTIVMRRWGLAQGTKLIHLRLIKSGKCEVQRGVNTLFIFELHWNIKQRVRLQVGTQNIEVRVEEIDFVVDSR